MKKIIEVKNLTKEYKSLKAVDDLSFDVYEGEIGRASCRERV